MKALRRLYHRLTTWTRITRDEERLLGLVEALRTE
jgi:hypothetical protein